MTRTFENMIQYSKEMLALWISRNWVESIAVLESYDILLVKNLITMIFAALENL